MIIPKVVNYVIDSEFASCFVYNGATRENVFGATRTEFDNQFHQLVRLPENMLHLSYEPFNNLYCVSIMEESGPVATAYTTDNLPSCIQDLVFETDIIYKWFYDQDQLNNPSSKYHVYNFEIHEWQISEENSQLLIQDNIVAKVQQRLNVFAQTRDYDNILSACTYATSVVPKFAVEGQYCVEARDLSWSALYDIFAEVASGTRPALTSYADVESELPTLVWPNLQ